MPPSKRRATVDINTRALKKPRCAQEQTVEVTSLDTTVHTSALEELPPLPTVDWLGELTEALKLKAPFKGREELSLQVFDLCPYSTYIQQQQWRESGCLYDDFDRRHLGVVDELGQHYWICYYDEDYFEQALHEIHMNRLLRQHQVPHVIAALCHVMLVRSKLICIVFPHHPLAVSLSDYHRGALEPFQITARDLEQGVQHIAATLQAVRWNDGEKRPRRVGRQALEFSIGRQLFDNNVMLVPDLQSNRVSFKLFDFHEGCARVGDRVHAAPQLDWHTVPYRQAGACFLVAAEKVAHMIGAARALWLLERYESLLLNL